MQDSVPSGVREDRLTCPNCGGPIDYIPGEWSWQDVIQCVECGATTGLRDPYPRKWTILRQWCEWPRDLTYSWPGVWNIRADLVFIETSRFASPRTSAA